MNKRNDCIPHRVFLGFAILSVVATFCLLGLAHAQNVTVDGVGLDEEQQGQYAQAQQQRAGDFASIRAETQRVLKFLEVRAVSVIQTPSEQAKVDDAVIVVRALGKRLMEAKASEEVTGVTVKRASLAARSISAARRLVRVQEHPESTQEDIDAAEVFAADAQAALEAFNVAHPDE